MMTGMESLMAELSKRLGEVCPDHPLAALPFAIDKEEALDCLADEEYIECRWEARPNIGVTLETPKIHIIAARLAIRASVSVARSGIEAQQMDFGIHVKAEMPGWGMGLLFFKTRPEKRVSEAQLAKERDGV